MRTFWYPGVRGVGTYVVTPYVFNLDQGPFYLISGTFSALIGGMFSMNRGLCSFVI